MFFLVSLDLSLVSLDTAIKSTFILGGFFKIVSCFIGLFHWMYRHMAIILSGFFPNPLSSRRISALHFSASDAHFQRFFPNPLLSQRILHGQANLENRVAIHALSLAWVLEKSSPWNIVLKIPTYVVSCGNRRQPWSWEGVSIALIGFSRFAAYFVSFYLILSEILKKM